MGGVLSISACESARLEALYRYEILDSGSDSAFDELTRLAAYLCRTPIAAISFVDTERQWFKSSVGLDYKEATMEGDFCAHTIAGTDGFIVENADADERFKNHPWVVGQPALRCYAGVPLLSPDGYAIGSLAVMDLVPRTLSPEQLIGLRTIAHQVMAQLELRAHDRCPKQQADTRNVPLFEQAGKGAHLLALCEDITARRKQEEVWKSRQQLQAIVEGTSDAVFIKDVQGRYLLFNSAAGRFVGKLPDEVIGRDDTFIFSCDDARSVRAGDCRVMAGGKTQTFEEVVTTSDGLRRTFMSTKGPLFGSDGAVIGLFGISRDITERHRVEEALRSSEERFRLVAETTLDILWDKDCVTSKMWWSPSARVKFGYDLNGDLWTSRLHPDDRDRVLAQVQAALSSKVARYSAEYRFRLEDGSYGHFLDRASIIRDRSGKPTRMIGAMIDVTGAKQAYLSLQDAYQQLQVMADKLQTVESDERRRLSRELHDEVGQLLTALKFDLESLRRGKASNKKMTQAQFAERLARALDITDLLFASLRHIVRSLRPPMLDSLGLKVALESLAAEVQARTDLVCSVQIKGTERLPGLTPAGETALYRIAQELLTNVIRHAEANTVSLSLWVDKNCGILTVQDDGMGFDPTTLPKVEGVGLRGIRERVEIFGGLFHLTSG